LYPSKIHTSSTTFLSRLLFIVLTLHTQYNVCSR
jgi:hypothetical protein